MDTIVLILSGLALLAAGICLALTVRNEKRSRKRNAALLQFVDSECKAVSTAAGAYTDEQAGKLENQAKNLEERVGKLEQGITPDYEQAKAAADAVNDFNKGISNLLGFDPHKALQESRRKGAGEAE